MKRILVTLTFVLGALTLASTVVSPNPSSVAGHTVLLSDDNPPPVCPPICSDGADSSRPVVVQP